MGLGPQDLIVPAKPLLWALGLRIPQSLLVRVDEMIH